MLFFIFNFRETMHPKPAFPADIEHSGICSFKNYILALAAGADFSISLLHVLNETFKYIN